MSIYIYSEHNYPYPNFREPWSWQHGRWRGWRCWGSAPGTPSPPRSPSAPRRWWPGLRMRVPAPPGQPVAWQCSDAPAKNGALKETVAWDGCSIYRFIPSKMSKEDFSIVLMVENLWKICRDCIQLAHYKSTPDRIAYVCLFKTSGVKIYFPVWHNRFFINSEDLNWRLNFVHQLERDSVEDITSRRIFSWPLEGDGSLVQYVLKRERRVVEITWRGICAHIYLVKGEGCVVLAHGVVHLTQPAHGQTLTPLIAAFPKQNVYQLRSIYKGVFMWEGMDSICRSLAPDSEPTKLLDHPPPKQKTKRGGGLRQINTCRKVSVQGNFLYDDILLCCQYS